VAGIAARDALAALAPGSEPRVKWPNDVLVGGRKIAGILLESASPGGASPDWLAVGVGMNLTAHPEDTEFPATSLSALGAAPPKPDEALLYLAANFAKWYDVWLGDGFSAIRDAWLARAAGLGGRIRARLTHEEATGVFEGIDEDGALLLRTSLGSVRAIPAGEVFFA
jgi:BirA family biotin operon repressor/biotin-[acetyl-CoA-carboxylase] ligase